MKAYWTVHDDLPGADVGLVGDDGDVVKGLAHELAEFLGVSGGVWTGTMSREGMGYGVEKLYAGLV